MSRCTWLWKWTAPAVAFALLVSVTAVSVARAEEEKDKAAKGTVTGTVKNQEGKPAADVRVQIRTPRNRDGGGGGGGGGGGQAPANPTAMQQGGQRPPPVAEGKTDAEGKFKLADVPVGSYSVVAGGRDQGGWARQAVEVKAGETVNVELQLQAGRPGGGGGVGAAAVGAAAVGAAAGRIRSNRPRRHSTPPALPEARAASL